MISFMPSMKTRILLTLVILFVLCSHRNMQQQKEIIYSPIGVIHSSFTPETGAPRQGMLMPDTGAEIEINKPYREALQHLDLFEYIIVIYHFDRVKDWEKTVSPPASTREHNFGLFGTRTPRRPNPIGFSVVKLDSIRDGVLHIKGIDAFDGSPVLDIKPYLPSIDCVESLRNEEMEKKLGLPEQVLIKD